MNNNLGLFAKVSLTLLMSASMLLVQGAACDGDKDSTTDTTETTGPSTPGTEGTKGTETVTGKTVKYSFEGVVPSLVGGTTKSKAFTGFAGDGVNLYFTVRGSQDLYVFDKDNLNPTAIKLIADKPSNNKPSEFNFTLLNDTPTVKQALKIGDETAIAVNDMSSYVTTLAHKGGILFIQNGRAIRGIRNTKNYIEIPGIDVSNNKVVALFNFNDKLTAIFENAAVLVNIPLTDTKATQGVSIPGPVKYATLADDGTVFVVYANDHINKIDPNTGRNILVNDITPAALKVAQSDKLTIKALGNLADRLIVGKEVHGSGNARLNSGGVTIIKDDKVEHELLGLNVTHLINIDEKTMLVLGKNSIGFLFVTEDNKIVTAYNDLTGFTNAGVSFTNDVPALLSREKKSPDFTADLKEPIGAGVDAAGNIYIAVPNSGVVKIAKEVIAK